MIVDEYAYIHFQKRKLKMDSLIKSFYILSERIIEKKTKGTPHIDVIVQYSEFVSLERDQEQLFRFKKRKLLDFLCASFSKKSIWIKQKLVERGF